MAQLQDHNFRTRMNFAYMADALYSFDNSIRCSSTMGRFIASVTTGETHEGRAVVSPHAYSHVWRKIENLYENMTDSSGTLMSELSPSEFMHFCSGATSRGFSHEGRDITAAAVRSKAADWSRRGWFRYEEKRDEKVKTAKRFGVVGGLILSSFIL